MELKLAKTLDDKEQALAFAKRILKKNCGGQYQIVKKSPKDTFRLACLSLIDQTDLSQMNYQVQY